VVLDRTAFFGAEEADIENAMIGERPSEA